MELWQLQQRQSLPLESKIVHSQNVIKQWHEHFDGKVYVSFSGGKDSTVLLHLVRELYPEVPAVYVDTGLEYPEIRDFVKTIDNVIWLKPKLSFKQVIDKYGYPVISKEQSGWIYDARTGKTEKQKLRINKVSKKWQYLINAPFKISDRCCYYLKKKPIKDFEKESNLHPYLGIIAQESSRRTQEYLKFGCNSFNAARPVSKPLSVWLEQDIWNYLKSYNIPYSKIYDMGESRTGCIFCMFGCHLEKEPNRFQRMKVSHPQLYEYCITKLGLGNVLDYINVKYK